MKNKLLVSSDHHANWDSLEHWFEFAKKENIPFVIPGDVVGDYNFEELVKEKGLKMPLWYSNNQTTKKLKKLFKDIVEYHAKKLASFIDKYGVKTYFLLGNHEPIYFCDRVIKHLKNKELFVDLLKEKGLTEVNGLKIAGISNTSQLMPFLSLIFDQKELKENFHHQLAERPVIHNFNKESLSKHELPLDDFDWLRIMGDQKQELDIFFTHGQIGVGAWKKDKYASEVPTLLSAAKLSDLAKITVDGHLHTTYMMRNVLGKPNIRAVGNKAFLIEKDNGGELSVEELESDKEYDAKGAGLSLKDLDEIKSPIDKLLGS